MLQQFNPMCKTDEVLWGGAYVPWDKREAMSPVDPDTWSWRDEPPPTRRDDLVGRHMPCLYTITRLYNYRIVTEPFTHHARTARTVYPRSLYTISTRTNNEGTID